ncbi:MAG: NAD(P)/FAD-dependent oxidoreductase [Burkholderiales bacterium]
MKVAVVGSGIAGLSCAYSLSKQTGIAVTLLEADSRLGGHSHTFDATIEGVTCPVDTGFLVYNERTYPGLLKLFKELDVASAASDMSFSVSLAGEIEWAGNNLATVFAQPQNLLRPRFLGMLSDIMRFNREARRIAGGPSPTQTLGEFLDGGAYGSAFRDWYLLPMAGAIWSCPTATMLDYPLSTFARFCANHGLLSINDRPRWLTVRGGSREYVTSIAARLPRVRTRAAVESVRPAAAGVLMRVNGQTERYDQVVLACHSDQALRLLDAPTKAQSTVLAAVRYQPNSAWLHTDRAQLPRRERVWAAWNYLGPAPGSTAPDARRVAVSYLLNRLQPLPFTTPLMVTLNPMVLPAEAQTLAAFEYSHPIFDAAAIRAQERLPSLQGEGGIWFAGAWTGFGFHEDGLRSGQAVARDLIDLAATRRAAA